MNRFWATLWTPDAFKNNPYGWATNQISHAALGAGVAWMLFQIGIWPWSGLGAYIVFELLQSRRGQLWRDAAEDTLFFAFGLAWTLGGGSWILLAILASLLAVGVWKRSS